MNLVEEAISELKPSDPIFSLSLAESYYDSSKHYVQIEKLSTPKKCSDKTAIRRLINKCFEESWTTVTERYKVNVDSIVTGCKKNIKEEMVKFLTHNMKQKFPMESKMGMFYRDKLFSKDVPGLDSAVMSLFNFYVDSLDVQNTMKVLEFLFIKYQHEFPDEPKRSSRRKRRRR